MAIAPAEGGMGALKDNSRFRGLLTWTLDRLQRQGFQTHTLPEDLRSRCGKAELNLQSWFVRHPLGTDAKFAHLYGPRSEILNVMIYPSNVNRVPVFAVELILFGNQPRVAVIDLQSALGVARAPRLMAEVGLSLAPIHGHFQPHLSDGGALPEWAKEHFTPHCIYSRPQNLRELPWVVGAYRRYFQSWLQDFWTREAEGPSAAEELGHYQRHHVANTPGRRYLHTSFGIDWTERYLSEFMYASKSH